jgi:hypothetical protein
MEMQGRRSEGIECLTTLAPNWEGSHKLQHHLWCHLVLFNLEYGDYAGVLELYDTRFRNLVAPVKVAAPDVYIDVQNASSMLSRPARLRRRRPCRGRRFDAPGHRWHAPTRGSHAQQDVLEQLFVDAALGADSTADVRLALERVASLRAIPRERFVGWREAANRAAGL